MQFRLIYDGPLQPSQRDPDNGQEDPVSLHKHKIRRAFHGQLKRLWETNRFLREYRVVRHDYFPDGPNLPPEPINGVIADMYCENGYRFVPLVRDDWHLLCSLDIVFLRRDIPGSIISAGDVDNRIKTLIDALRKPKGKLEVPCPPQEGEDPFYCLLEDDKNVTSLSVETDTLLDPMEGNADNRRVRLYINVELKPYYTDTLQLNRGFL